MAQAAAWFASWFERPLSGEGTLPVSFLVAGTRAQPHTWQPRWDEEPGASGLQTRSLTLTDQATGLVLRLEVTQYGDFPAVAWVGYLRNTGQADSPVLSEIKALDIQLMLAHDAPCRLHHALGSDCKINDFAPQETELGPSTSCQIGCLSGRSSEATALPFFNLELTGEGIIGAVGWTGSWTASFARDKAGQVQVTAGMPKTHLLLHPGEEIRTPRILLLFWQGERLRGHNLLRRFILAHHTPRPNGELLQGPITFAAWGENTCENQLAKARWLVEHRIPLDAFWIDAGWHGDAPFREDSTVFNSSWYANVGNWWPNPNTYPDGLKPIGDYLKQAGLGFVLWFEPERNFRGTQFVREHPEWMLGAGDNFLFNLGDPQARQALADTISQVISEGGITIYRQDFNTTAAHFWEAADTPDRVGMTEIRHIEGLYAFWDELLARHPGLIIDNCASGGRRIDLETISRSIPLWRSDFQCFPGYDPIGIQGQTHGLGLWVPLSTGAVDRPATYDFRSALGTGMVIQSTAYERTPPPPYPAEWLRERVAEQVAVRPYFSGDFYPLLSYSLSEECWACWQFDRPDLGQGMVLALRRQRSPFPRLEATLQGLDPEAEYAVCNVDSSQTCTARGRQLATQGFTIEIAQQPGSALFTYQRND